MMVQLSRRRLPLAMFLLLMVGLLGVGFLTRLALQTHQRQRDTAKALLGGITERVTSRMATDITSELYIAATAVFSRAGMGRMGDPVSRRGDPTTILTAALDVKACNCAAVLTPRYAFRADLSANHSVTVSDSGDFVGPNLAPMRGLIDTLRDAGGWDFAIDPELDEGGRILFFARVPGQDGILMGFAVDSSLLRSQIIEQVFNRRFTSYPKMGLPALQKDDMTLAFRLGNGRSLVQTADYAPTAAMGAPSRLGLLFGSFDVVGQLNEAAGARLLGTSVGYSPVPLFLVFAFGAALAMVIAFVAWRRSSELAETRADIVASMSHELRTPLTEILLVGESLQRGHYATPTEHRNAVDVVVRESQRLLAMIGNVLHMATNRQGETLALQLQTMGGEVTRIVADYAPLAATRGIELHVTIEDDPPIECNQSALRQILLNLLDNACRHGPGNASVVVRLMTVNGWLRLSVQDEGAGISTALGDSAWRPYVRETTMVGDAHQGSGIGLAVVQQLAEQQGGRTGTTGSAVFVEWRVPA